MPDDREVSVDDESEIVCPSPSKVVGALIRSGVEVFHDDRRCGWIRLPNQTTSAGAGQLPLDRRDPRLRVLLRRTVEELVKVEITRSKLADILDELVVLALNGTQFPLANRFATHDGAIYVDLCDTTHQAIRVRPQGWEIVTPAQPLFQRFAHQASLNVPQGGSEIFGLFDFLRITEPNEQLLVIAWLSAALNPLIAKPILLQIGEPGAAKSTQARMLRRLIDPSRMPLLGDWEQRTSLLSVFLHHAVPCFDNVGRMTRKEADVFCRAVTGAGMERRALYTNDDQVLFSFRRAILMNAVELPSDRCDLLDRCIVLNLSRIRDFVSESTLEVRFAVEQPRLLGALLDLTAKALSVLCTVEPSDDFRMADFSHFGRAVAIALGRQSSDFDAAYRGAQQAAHEELFEHDFVAATLTKFLQVGPFQGTVTELLGRLKQSAGTIRGSKKAGFPASAKLLSEWLVSYVPSLNATGIDYERLPRRASQRLIRLSLRLASATG